MDRRFGKRLLPALGITVLLAAAASPGLSTADQYVYSDDFSTDKAIVDSYWHSEFLEDLPDPWPVEGFLRYESYASPLTLSFYNGSGHDAHAWLRYELPLDAGSREAEYTSASVELELVDSWGGGCILCGCSLEGGAPWEWPGAWDLGPCAFDFEGSAPAETVFIWFRGCNASIDDLVITLRSSTPVEAESWARIKHVLGGPPN